MYIKKILKISKYSPSYTVTFACTIIFIVVAALLWITDIVNAFTTSRIPADELDTAFSPANMNPMGYFWSAFILLQILSQMNQVLTSSYIRTSPESKKLLVQGGTEITILLSGIIYSLLVPVKYLVLRAAGLTAGTVLFGAFLYTVMVCTFSIYITFFYKIPPLALAAYILGFFVLFYFMSDMAEHPFVRLLSSQNPLLIILLGYAGVLLNGLLYYVLANISYKLPYSQKMLDRLAQNAK